MRGVWRRAPVAVLAAVVVSTLAFAGCGGSDQGSEKKTFSVYIGEPQHLIPGNSQEGNGIAVISGVFEGLTQLLPGKGVQMDVAKSVKSKDKKTWTIKLKRGRTFHNGEKVTARSFVDAWNAAAYAPNGWVNNYFFANIKGYDALNPKSGKPKTKTMSGLKIVNDYTFKVELTSPFSQFPLTLAYTGFDPLPQVAFKNFKKFEEAPVGNGPFEMAGKWQHNQGIKLKAYDKYVGPREPQSDGVDFKIYSSAETGYEDLIADNLDIDDQLPPEKLDDAKTQLGDRYFTRPSSNLHYLGFPVYDKRWQDPDLRHAISMAINRKAINKAIYNGAYQPADSYISPIVPGYRKGACGKWCEFHPSEAKQLFKKAGGWDGPMTIWYAQDTYPDNELQAIANQLKNNLGIDVHLKKQLFAAYLDSIRAHKVHGPYRLDWGMDYPSPQNYLEPLYSTGGSSNRISYSDKAVDSFIAKGNRAPSIKAGNKYYNKAEDVLIRQMPTAPLFFGQKQVGHSDDVTNVKEDALVGIYLWDVKVKG